VSQRDTVTLEDVLDLVKQLSPIDKVRLIERVAPEIERALAGQRHQPGRSLLGLVKDLGLAPSADQIDTARQEAWASFLDDDS
jgi:hypothetical protein